MSITKDEFTLEYLKIIDSSWINKSNTKIQILFNEITSEVDKIICKYPQVTPEVAKEILDYFNFFHLISVIIGEERLLLLETNEIKIFLNYLKFLLIWLINYDIDIGNKTVN